MQEHTVIDFITVVGPPVTKLGENEISGGGQNENDIGEATLAIKTKMSRTSQHRTNTDTNGCRLVKSLFPSC